jgi:hypothetical protein
LEQGSLQGSLEQELGAGEQDPRRSWSET